MTKRKNATATTGVRRRLGRGLESLISTRVAVSRTPPHSPPPLPEASAEGGPGPTPPRRDGAILMVGTDQIRPNPRQPRQSFNDEALQSLAASIRSAGLMQPVVLRPDPSGDRDTYELVVGERRWRAAKLIGLQQLPAVIREIDDRTAGEWALVENIQREDLNPIERAEAFRRLIDEHGVTHQELAERVGLNRSSVSNLLRLNELDEFARGAVRSGRLGLGHAKALLSVGDLDARRRLAELAIRQSLSVRALERRVATLNGDGRRAARADGHRVARSSHEALARQIGEQLGTRVHIQPGKTKGSGRLVIEFYSLDQFDGLIQRMAIEVG